MNLTLTFLAKKLAIFNAQTSPPIVLIRTRDSAGHDHCLYILSPFKEEALAKLGESISVNQKNNNNNDRLPKSTCQSIIGELKKDTFPTTLFGIVSTGSTRKPIIRFCHSCGKSNQEFSISQRKKSGNQGRCTVCVEKDKEKRKVRLEKGDVLF